MMDTKIGWRIGFIALVVVLSAFYLAPTAQLAGMDAEARAALSAEDPQALDELEQNAIALGLDLQGGIHLVLEVDPTDLTEEELADAHRRALEVIRNRIDEFGVEEPIIQQFGEGRILVQLAGVVDPERAKNIIRRTAFLEFKLVAKSTRVRDILQIIDEVAFEVDRDRLLETEDGAEEDVATADAAADTGEFADLFADLDVEPTERAGQSENPFLDLLRLIDYGGGSFAIVVAEENMDKVQGYLDHPEVRDLMPDELEFRFGVIEEVASGSGAAQRQAFLYLLERDAELTGESIETAGLTFGQNYNEPVVSVTFRPDYARRFAEITGNNIGRQLAIILDGKVRSAPNLRVRIPDGRCQVEGGFTSLEANDLAVVLRSGALPAPVRIIEERTVGATLGADSVAAGRNAGLFGLCLVLSFMLVYYRTSGAVADLVLLLNTLFILACLAAFGATLTLPGIAGIVLTMGMAVDANVLVFERIREEFRTGKSVIASVQSGFERAFGTILDANVTTFLTALILFYFGSGPIRGFAITLMIGIVTSVFTAVFCSRVIFDLLYSSGRVRRLSI